MEINFYQEMASEHQLQENGRSTVPFIFCLDGILHIILAKGSCSKSNMYRIELWKV